MMKKGRSWLIYLIITLVLILIIFFIFFKFIGNDKSNDSGEELIKKTNNLEYDLLVCMIGCPIEYRENRDKTFTFKELNSSCTSKCTYEKSEYIMEGNLVPRKDKNKLLMKSDEVNACINTNAEEFVSCIREILPILKQKFYTF